MQSYPSISSQVQLGASIVAFDKLDGSLIRAEFRKKNGFSKFGRKEGLLDHACPILLKSIDLIKDGFGQAFADIVHKHYWMFDGVVTAYFEFVGPKSFAGEHDLNDNYKVVLLDVETRNEGMLGTREFLDLFGHLAIPQVLYEGAANKTFVEQVKNSTLPGMTFEGVVCKGQKRKNKIPLMFKIKSNAWHEKLRIFCGQDDKMFERLV